MNMMISISISPKHASVDVDISENDIGAESTSCKTHSSRSAPKFC